MLKGEKRMRNLKKFVKMAEELGNFIVEKNPSMIEVEVFVEKQMSMDLLVSSNLKGRVN